MTRADLSIYQGDDYVVAVTVNNADGSPADLTGHSAMAQIRQKAADLAPVTAEFSAVIQSNLILLALTHDQTLLLKGGYVWDMQITNAGGAITTLLYGQVKVTQEVTRVEVRKAVMA